LDGKGKREGRETRDGDLRGKTEKRAGLFPYIDDGGVGGEEGMGHGEEKGKEKAAVVSSHTTI
jgi:hypothetical protein